MKLYEETLQNINENEYERFASTSSLSSATKLGVKDFMSPKNLKFYGVLSAGMTLGVPLLSAIFKGIRAQLSQAHKKCGGQNDGPGFSVCVNKEKLKIFNNALQQLNNARSKCGNNVKCQNRIDMKIEEIRRKIMLAHREIEEVTNQIEAAKRENVAYRSMKVNEQFMGAMAKKALGAGKYVVGGFVVPAVLYGVFDRMLAPVYRGATLLASSAERKCAGTAEGPARDACKSRIKMQALKQKADVLTKVSNMCKSKLGAGNSKCIKYMTKLDEINNQIKAFEDNIEVYEQALRTSAISGATGKTE